jgi:hypothetical protein
MKKILISTLLLSFAIAPAFSQSNASNTDRSQTKEKLQALKTAFFIENLEMTQEESESFFSRQDELKEALSELNKEIREISKAKKDTATVSDEEYSQREIKMAEFQKKKIDLNSSFILDCFNILDAKRAITLDEINKEFRKEMLATRKENNKKKENVREK